MNHGTRIRAAALLLALSAAACGDSGQTAPIITPGVVDIFVATPNAQDQALLLSFGGELGGFTAASGFDVVQQIDDAAATVLVVSAAPLAAGETRIGSFAVQDTTRIRTITAQLTEAAGADYALRSNISGYIVRLQKR
jgi:hypothetical protein